MFASVGFGPLSSSDVGGFVPSNQWDDGLVGEKRLGFCASPGGLSVGGRPCLLLPPRPFLMFSMLTGCSSQFLPGMSWRAHQLSFVFEVVESSKGGDLKVGVVDYPEAVQGARLCYHTMGISYGGDEKGFSDFLT